MSTSLKRVTNAQFSSLEDESILICFMNMKKEGFIPRKGPSSFDFMSLMKVNSFVVSCLESLK